MADRPLCNARIQAWLADDLARAADDMDSTKALVNSAAIWWYCQKLPPEDQARILGEYVTAAALRGRGDGDGTSVSRRGRGAKPG
jgi:hypothetical protein